MGCSAGPYGAPTHPGGTVPHLVPDKQAGPPVPAATYGQDQGSADDPGKDPRLGQLRGVGVLSPPVGEPSLGSLSLQCVALATFDDQFLGPGLGDQGMDLGRLDADRSCEATDTCEPNCAEGVGSIRGEAILSGMHMCGRQLRYLRLRFVYFGAPEHNLLVTFNCQGGTEHLHIGP